MCCCLFNYTDGFSEDIFGSWKSKAATAATTYWIIFSIFLTPRSWGVCALVLAPSACRSEDLGQGYHPFQCFDIPGDLGFPRGNFDWFFGWQVYGGWLLVHLIFLHFKQQWEVAVIRHRLVCVNRTSELAVACWSFPKYLIFEVLLLQMKNELFISTPCFMQMIKISLHFWGGAAPELPLNIEVFLTCSNSTSALHCLHCLTKLGFTCLSALPSQVSEANVLFGQFSGGCPPQMMLSQAIVRSCSH